MTADEKEIKPEKESGDQVSFVAQFGVTFVAAYLIYLVLTMGSGTDILFWSIEELFAGVILSLVVGFFGKKFLFLNARDIRMLSPARWINFLIYIPSFLVAMAKANVDVAKMVITGKINPGIVRIRPELKSDLGISLLANSITLTPGTLTLDIDEKTHDLFIHWINVDMASVHENDCDIAPVCGSFPDSIRRITE